MEPITPANSAAVDGLEDLANHNPALDAEDITNTPLDPNAVTDPTLDQELAAQVELAQAAAPAEEPELAAEAAAEAHLEEAAAPAEEPELAAEAAGEAPMNEAGGFGELADVATVWKGTELQQFFSFNQADLSLLLYKAQNGQMRALSGLDNNNTDSVVGHEERSRSTQLDTSVSSAEFGSGDDAFVRITDVNNYPGPGNISQGVDGNPIAGRLQLEGPDGAPLPNERDLSNALLDQGATDIPERDGWNNMFMGAGQYIDHGQGLLNKGGQGSFYIPLPGDDQLYGKVRGNELSLLPRGTSVDTDPGEASYMNTVTSTIDQNQAYGSDEVIHGYLREKTAGGMMTAKLLSNKWSAETVDGADGLPTFYDVLINNGADKSALDAVLGRQSYLFAHAKLSEWDAKVRAGDSSVTGNPTADGMGQYMGMLSTSMQELKVAAGPAWVDPFSVLPNSNQQLLGDASHLAKFDAISLADHLIAGDLRANENAQLSAFHNAFSNFHNNTVDGIIAALQNLPADAASTPGLEGLADLKANLNTEEAQQAIFDMARMVMNAGYQRMVYDQYVVALAGGIPFGITNDQDSALMPDPNKLTPQPLALNEHGFNGWQPEVRPSVALEYSTAGFRVGHSQVGEYLNGITLETIEDAIEINDTITQSLIQAFVNPEAIRVLGGAAGVLAANAQEHAQAVDTWMVNAVRNMLVGRPNDLGAFNLARNNELGIPTLNEFRQNITDLYKSTGIGNALGYQASDVSGGLIDTDGQTDLFLERIKPYESWAEFGENLRDSSQLDTFMQLFGGPAAAYDNNIGLINVPLWLGGLAESPVTTPTGEGDLPSLMGSTFTYAVQESFDRAQDFDRWYYKIDIAGTDILKQLGFQTFTPMLQTALGKAAQFIHQDTFRTFEIDSLAKETEAYQAAEDVRDQDGRTVNRLILGNALDNQIEGSRGSDDIRAGAGDDSVDGNRGEDWIYGQAGNDVLFGGDDNELDHLFGGEGNDVLVADNGSEDALFGEDGNDVLIRQNAGGMSDGGLGSDILLGGKDNDILDGDSGAPDGENPSGDDTIIGGRGDDIISGGAGHDLLVAGESGVLGDVVVGDAMADANAELLARAIRDEEGKIVATLLPLFTGLGYAVTVGGVNPLTGALFSDEELQEFREYIHGLRQAPDLDDPGNRGPQPVMVLMPFTGVSGHDTIYTGTMSAARELLLEACGDDEILKALILDSEEFGEVAAAFEPVVEAVEEVVAVEEEPVATELEPVVAEVEPVEAEAGQPVVKVFAGGGNDTVITDGEVSTVVFGGAGYDTLKANDRDGAQHLHIAAIDTNGADPVENGADGVIFDDHGVSDQFYAIEEVVLNDGGDNSLSIDEALGSVVIDFNHADDGHKALINPLDSTGRGLTISGVDRYSFGGSSQDRIKLGGKLDYDGQLDSNKSDDNHQISWDGYSLKIQGRNTGAAEFKGVEWVEFNYQDVNNPSGGITKEFYYKEFAEKALNLGFNLVKDPQFPGDATDEIVLRQFGNAEERASKFYLQITAESLRDARINTLDFTVNLGETFGDVFDLNPELIGEQIVFTGDLAAQRNVQLIEGESGPQLRFTGAGLEALSVGQSIGEQTVLAYVGLSLRGDIDQLIKAARGDDQYGFRNDEAFSVPLHFSADASVDQVVWDDLLSLRDLGGQYAFETVDMHLTARAAEAAVNVQGAFDIGTYREVLKPGEGSYTNLVRAGDTILQTSTWRNEGEFTFTDLKLAVIDRSDAAALSAVFQSTNSAELSELGWSREAGNGEAVDVVSTFTIDGNAGSVVDFSELGFDLTAYGDFSWDTTRMEQFQGKHLVTYQSDVNYDGSVTMKDLAFINAGAAAGGSAHDVDVNYDGSIDMNDLSVVDAEWGANLHNPDGSFTGSDRISLEELFSQAGHSWDSSAFADQNAIVSGELSEASNGHERAYQDVLLDSAPGLLTAAMEMPSEEERNYQAYALTAV